MCIIVAKKSGVALPSEETLQKCWNRNSDGAGFMYKNPKTGRIHIVKGLMSFKVFLRALSALDKRLPVKDLDLVLHFRITSRGTTCAQQTHPFPLTNDETQLEAKSAITTIGIAHNGTMPIKLAERLNDTQTFIKNHLWNVFMMDKHFYKNENAMKMIEFLTDSKLAMLTPEGIALIGKFVESKGVYYSNNSFEGYGRVIYSSNCYGGWGVHDYDYDVGCSTKKDKYTDMINQDNQKTLENLIEDASKKKGKGKDEPKLRYLNCSLKTLITLAGREVKNARLMTKYKWDIELLAEINRRLISDSLSDEERTTLNYLVTELSKGYAQY